MSIVCYLPRLNANKLLNSEGILHLKAVRFIIFIQYEEKKNYKNSSEIPHSDFLLSHWSTKEFPQKQNQGMERTLSWEVGLDGGSTHRPTPNQPHDLC